MIFALTPSPHADHSPSFVINILIHKATPQASAPSPRTLLKHGSEAIHSTLLFDTDTLWRRLTREERILDKGVRLRISLEQR
jgi:hypothetical protein